MTNETTDRAALLERLTSDTESGDATRRYVCTWVPVSDDTALRRLAVLVRAYREATRQPRLDAANQILAWCRGDDA